MPRVVWSTDAERDLIRTHEFLFRHDLEAARRAVKAIRMGVKRLGRFPRMGRLVADLPSEYREWSIPFGCGGYVVRYWISDAAVLILALRQGREETWGLDL